MDEKPRETGLYRKIAKDYNPKQAEMQICKCIEDLAAVVEQVKKDVEKSRSDIAQLSASKTSHSPKNDLRPPKTDNAENKNASDK